MKAWLVLLAVLVALTCAAAAIEPEPAEPSGGTPSEDAGGARTSDESPPLRLLRRIAWCESRGNPRALSPGGRYRGLFQFDFPTWRSVGGRGDPARATPAEQYRRAALLFKRRGRAPWPVCGWA